MLFAKKSNFRKNAKLLLPVLRHLKIKSRHEKSRKMRRNDARRQLRPMLKLRKRG